jgi:hypothetical protein
VGRLRLNQHRGEHYPHRAAYNRILAISALGTFDEKNPVIISTFSLPDRRPFKDTQGRFGAHNLKENKPGRFRFNQTR